MYLSNDLLYQCLGVAHTYGRILPKLHEEFCFRFRDFREVPGHYFI